MGGTSATSVAGVLSQDVSLAPIVASVLPTLPGWDPEPRTAHTMADAVALVHARDDARKKVASGPSQSKAKRASGRGPASSAAGDRLPGVVRGGGDATAFWLYVEDYFRDATAEDVALLAEAVCSDPRADPLLRVPDVGPPPEAVAPVPAPAPPAPAAAAALGAGAALGTPTPAPESATPGSGEQPSSPDSAAFERRSMRLVSRLRRGGSSLGPGSADAELGTPLPDGADDKATPASAPAGPAAECSVHFSSTEPNPASSPFLPGAQAANLRTRTGQPRPPPGTRCLLETLAPEEVLRLCSMAATRFPRLSLEALDEELLAAPGGSAPAQRTPVRRNQLRAVQPDTFANGDASPALDNEESAAEEKDDEKVALFERKDRAVAWLLRAADGVQAQSGALEPCAWPLGEPEEVARPAGAPAGARDAPCTLSWHPYTERLLAHPVPEHVLASANALPSGPQQDGGPALGQARSALVEEEASEAPSGSSSPRTRPQTPVPAAGLGARPPRPPASKTVHAAPREAPRQIEDKAAAEAAGAPLPPVAAAAAAFELAGRDVADDECAARLEVLPLLAAAPQDEILAEILALQSELLAQRVSNRRRAAAALRGALADLDSTREALRQEERVVRAALFAAREERRAASRQRREAAHRAAMAQKTSLVLSSPRPVLGRQRVSLGGSEDVKGEAPLLGPNELYDVLAERGAEDEAYCAVCGDGHSEAPNQIVFCERCDVAVHQRCYDVGELPAGEWLCHPCREYEAARLAAGEAPEAVRPPRWAEGGGGPRRLPGGARDAVCALCPIKLGAFRRAVEPDGRWVHAVCALWAPESYLLPGEGAAVVAGLESVRVNRAACAICGRSQGSVVGCSAGGCGYAFHPLCARNLGLYLAVRADGHGRPQYRVYCAVHSAREQERDRKAWQARQEAARASADLEARRGAALARLAAREEERRALGTLRLNLEQARMLVDLTKKRERLKRQLVTLFLAEHGGRLRDPVLALARLQAQHAQHAAAVQALLLSGAMRVGPLVAAAAQQQAAAAAQSANGGVNGGQNGSNATAPNATPAAAPPTPGVVRGPSPAPQGLPADAAAAWTAMQVQQAQVFARLSQLNSQTLLRLGMLGGSPVRGVAPAAAQQQQSASASGGPAPSQPSNGAAEGAAAPSPALAPAAAAAAAAAAAGFRSPFPLLPPGLLGLPGGFGLGPPPGLLASFSPQLLQAQQAAAAATLGAAAGGATADAAHASGAGRGAGAAKRGGAASVAASRRGKGIAGRGRGAGAPAAAAAATAPLGVPASLAAISTKTGAAPSGLGNPAAVPPSLRIDRERVMTPKEAADANRRLPPKFKYVPLQELHAAQRQGAQPAAEAAGESGEERAQPTEEAAAVGAAVEAAGTPHTKPEPAALAAPAASHEPKKRARDEEESATSSAVTDPPAPRPRRGEDKATPKRARDAPAAPKPSPRLDKTTTRAQSASPARAAASPGAATPELRSGTRSAKDPASGRRSATPGSTRGAAARAASANGKAASVAKRRRA